MTSVSTVVVGLLHARRERQRIEDELLAAALADADDRATDGRSPTTALERKADEYRVAKACERIARGERP